jgi:hypothetical protein
MLLIILQNNLFESNTIRKALEMLGNEPKALQGP